MISYIPGRADNEAAYPGKRKREEGASADETLEESLARRVRTEEITLSTLKTKLLTHVDQVDATEALEFITRSGRADANATRGAELDVYFTSIITLHDRKPILVLCIERPCCVCEGKRVRAYIDQGTMRGTMTISCIGH